MGLCNFTPVGGLEAFLEAINVYTGLPWWGTIVSATVLIRLALMPVVVKIQRNNAALRNISPEVGRLTDSLKQAQASGDSVAVAQLSNDLRRLFQKNNCHPLKSLGMPLLQMPVMVSFFLALRAMSELPVPGLQDGGLAWFTDLTAKDPCYALPALSAGAMLAVLEAGGEVGATSTQAQSMKNVFRFITVAMIPATAWMPSVSGSRESLLKKDKTNLIYLSVVCVCLLVDIQHIFDWPGAHAQEPIHPTSIEDTRDRPECCQAARSGQILPWKLEGAMGTSREIGEGACPARATAGCSAGTKTVQTPFLSRIICYY